MTPKTSHPGIADLIETLHLSNESNDPKNLSNINWEILELSKHLKFINDWVHMPYAKAYWQMDHLNYDELRDHYDQILQSSTATSLIGHYNGMPVCQIELYDCQHDEISKYYNAQPGDIGLHFLMAPIKGSIVQGLSLKLMRSALSILLNNQCVSRVIGEPDIRNTKANALVQKAGFYLVKQITMSYKQANLYYCTKASFTK